MEPAAYTFEDLSVGQVASFEIAITQELIDQFASLSGDASPLHVDSTFAKTTPFNGTIAHGMLGGAFFSRLVGMHLPGKHALYLSQSLLFKKPIRPGMHITVTGEIIYKTEALRSVTLRTTIATHDDTICTEGEAMVRLLK